MVTLPTHSPFQVPTPKGWTLLVSHDHDVRRLVVFVHGFNGHSMKTWLDFPSGGASRGWWRQADLLFVGYESLRENISGVANRLRRELPRFYPDPFPDAMEVGGIAARSTVTPYEELVLVGHSLGGLILRRATADAVTRWRDEGYPSPAPALASGRLRLFSPASAGFQASGLLGAAKATGIWGAIEFFLCSSSAYNDLQPGSTVLTETKARTEELAAEAAGKALRAHIMWANPDEVVITERYKTDFVDDSSDGTNHSSVCKPRKVKFETPWNFVETGLA